MDLAYKIEFSGPLFDGRAVQGMQDETDAFIVESVAYLETLVKKYTPVGVFGAQGGLLGGIYGEPVQLGSPVAMGIVGHQSGIYGDIVERGRQPGKMPPKGSLIRWINVVLGVEGKRAEGLDYAIRRKIAERGTQGAAMFFNAMEEGWPVLQKMAQKSGGSIADKMRGNG